MDKGIQIVHEELLEVLRRYRDYCQQELDAVNNKITKLTYTMHWAEAELEKEIDEDK